ncbi:MAG TPA: hypothetical protein VGK19_13355 [Capsulimonadaceae bacterium]|jgi:hypothetical protein
MAGERLDKHGSPEAKQLFERDTAQVGSLGDIVEKHGGDNLVLVPERSVGGADSGEADFEAEMNPNDPSGEWEGLDDTFPGEDDEDAEGMGETDITGTAPGIARGFGSHLAQDLGRDGFQIEEIPDRAIRLMGQTVPGEELDDYDDADSTNGVNDSRELGRLSEPGRLPADLPSVKGIQTRGTRAVNATQDLDSGTL